MTYAPINPPLSPAERRRAVALVEDSDPELANRLAEDLDPELDPAMVLLLRQIEAMTGEIRTMRITMVGGQLFVSVLAMAILAAMVGLSLSLDGSALGLPGIEVTP